MATDNYIARAGTAATVGTANWAQNAAKKSITPWLPARNTPIAPGLPPLGREYRMALETLFDRIGPLLGMSVPEVQAAVALVQGMTLDVQTAALEAQSQAAANTASIIAIKEVAVNNGLSGAGNIP